MNPEIRYLAQQLLHAGLAPLCERDRRVITRVARRVHTARDVNQEFEQNLTFGDKLADKVAVLGGSWTFIMGFCAFLLAWALLNAVVLAGSAFDPYPFVFLNLLLSMVAALQAPIISIELRYSSPTALKVFAAASFAALRCHCLCSDGSMPADSNLRASSHLSRASASPISAYLRYELTSVRVS
jgi:hypothetical protein